jgi:capsular polysaccharide biosynthesis protein
MEKQYDLEDEIEIDLREVFYALWKRLWLICLALIIGGGLTTLYCKVILIPQYTSTSMVYILSKETTLTSLADLQIGSQLTKDYRVVATSRPVLQEVIDTLNLDRDYDDLKESLIFDNPKDTRVLSISIEDPDPVKAKAIVDTVAKVSSKHIGDIMEMTPPKIIEDGFVATKKSSPNVTRNAAIGGLAAAIAVAGLITLKVVLNDTIRSEEDVEKYLQLSVLAAIPEREEARVSVKGKKSRRKKGRG